MTCVWTIFPPKKLMIGLGLRLGLGLDCRKVLDRAGSMWTTLNQRRSQSTVRVGLDSIQIWLLPLNTTPKLSVFFKGFQFWASTLAFLTVETYFFWQKLLIFSKALKEFSLFLKLFPTNSTWGFVSFVIKTLVTLFTWAINPPPQNKQGSLCIKG